MIGPPRILNLAAPLIIIFMRILHKYTIFLSQFLKKIVYLSDTVLERLFRFIFLPFISNSSIVDSAQQILFDRTRFNEHLCVGIMSHIYIYNHPLGSGPLLRTDSIDTRGNVKLKLIKSYLKKEFPFFLLEINIFLLFNIQI